MNNIRWMIAGMVLALVCLNSMVRADNLLLEGGDFEAGTNGLGIRPMVLVRNLSTYVAPSIDDTTAAHGQRSLKLVNGSGQDVFNMLSRAVRINNPQGPASISFYAKSDTPDAVVRVALCAGHKGIIAQSFTLTDQWVRYEVTKTPLTWVFPPSDVLTPYVYYLSMTTPALKPWGTIWIDAVQVEMGPVTPYAQVNAVDLAFTNERALKVYFPNEPVHFTLRAAGKSIVRQSVTLQVEELLTGTTEPTQNLQLISEGDEDHGRVEINLPPYSRGCYRLTARTADGRTVQYQGFGVIVPLRDRPHEQRAFFGGSIETTESTTAHAGSGLLPKIPGDSLFCSYYNIADVFALARNLGWGWWHAYWPYSPMVIQPDGPDKSIWRDTDTLTDLARKADLDIMANLAAHGGLEQVPSWIRGEALGKGGTWRGHGEGQRLTDPEKFGVYCRTVVEHFHDRVKMWEPWNEPGVKMHEDEYLPLLKASYENIKAIDPSAQVYGLCGTWDVSGDLMGWVKGCLKLGADKYMDGITIHGYHVADRHYVANVEKQVKEISVRSFPIIDSEAGNYCTFSVYPQLIDAFVNKPGSKTIVDSMAQLLVNELVCGAKRSSWFSLTDFYTGIHTRSFVLLEYDGSPTPTMIAYNTLADRLGPARFVQEVPFSGDVVAQVFDDGQGHGLAVLWTQADPQTILVPLAADDALTENLLGKAQKPATEKANLKIPLTSRPLFLRTPHLDATQLATALSKAEVVGLNDLEITRIGLIHTAPGTPALAVGMRGRTTRPRQGRLEIESAPSAWKLATPQRSFNPLLLNEQCRVDFPITAGLDQSDDAHLRLALDSGSHVLVFAKSLKIWKASASHQSITLDGDLAEWDNALFHPLADWADAAVQWNANGLYVAMRTRDATPQNTPNLESWRHDCVELYFNPKPEENFLKGDFIPGDAQVICPVTMQGQNEPAVETNPSIAGPDNRPRMAAATIRRACRRDAQGYTMEIFIPWENFPQDMTFAPGQFMGFSVSVRDTDAVGNDLRRVIWTGDNDNYRVTRNYGTLLLTP